MPHCTYQTTNDNRGYSNVHVGSTKEAEKLYPKNMGLTLLRAVTSNNNSTAKDEVVFSVGPVSQEHGLRTENPSDPGVFRRNPLNTRRAVTTSVLLSGVGILGSYMALQSFRDEELTKAAVYGVTGLMGFAMLPDVEVRV
jgi:hypothetical protein